MGAPLGSKLDLETDLRFLVVSKRLIFYRVNEDRIEVTRVLDGRQDYMTHLFDGEGQIDFGRKGQFDGRNGKIFRIASSRRTPTSIRGYVIEAQGQVYTAVSTAMVTAYWKISKSIFDACGENDQAAYGKHVLKYISERLTEEFEKGFSVPGLRNMRQFYLTFYYNIIWLEPSAASRGFRPSRAKATMRGATG